MALLLESLKRCGSVYVSPRDELGQVLEDLGPAERDLVKRFAEGLGQDAAGLRGDLLAVVGELGDEQVEKLLRVARVMALPIEETLLPGSDVATKQFAAEFRARLQAHHATHTSPMDRLSFESAFLSASRAADRVAHEAPSRTTRFYDATVDDIAVALKTEGAQSMKADQLHISKLSEAAWIQDMRSARKRHDRTMDLVEDFLEAVDRLFVLRYYRKEPVPHYELVEIPVDHFRLLEDAPISAFDSDSPRIVIRRDGDDLMQFNLDRSDSKITVSKIAKAHCVVHGDWRLTGVADEGAEGALASSD